MKLREEMMEKIYPSAVYRSCHLEVSAYMYISFKTTLLNMMQKQQGQISRNFFPPEMDISQLRIKHQENLSS